MAMLQPIHGHSLPFTAKFHSLLFTAIHGQFAHLTVCVRSSTVMVRTSVSIVRTMLAVENTQTARNADLPLMMVNENERDLAANGSECQ